MQHLSYTIKKRGGEIIGAVSCQNPKQAFLSAMFWVKNAYAKAGIEQPLFTTDPDFYAEPEYR